MEYEKGNISNNIIKCLQDIKRILIQGQTNLNSYASLKSHKT